MMSGCKIFVDDSEVVAYNFEGEINCLYIIVNKEFVGTSKRGVIERNGNWTLEIAHSFQVYVIDLLSTQSECICLESGIEFSRCS